MTRTIAAACALLAVSAQTTAPPPAQQPVFRSTLDVVTVDVSVRTSGTPVAGLTAKDFVLLDNGVRQTISSVEMEEVPIDVSVLDFFNQVNGGYLGGRDYSGTLRNNGVLLAPFHDYEDQISADLKAGIETLRGMLVEGQVSVCEYLAEPC